MKLLLNGPVEHDGKAYAEGSMIELADEYAEPLLVAGAAIMVVEDEAPKGGKAKAKAEPAPEA